MKIIGVTGGVGSGKSEVMKYIAGNYDAAVLLADHAGHLLMKTGQPCYQRIRQLFGDRVLDEDGEAAAEQGKTFFFLEAALLLEEHYDEICDEVWYIYAQQSVRRERLKKSRNYSDEKITQMIANQLDEEEFKERCCVTIDNSGTFENTVRQIEARMKQWRTP